MTIFAHKYRSYYVNDKKLFNVIWVTNHWDFFKAMFNKDYKDKHIVSVRPNEERRDKHIVSVRPNEERRKFFSIPGPRY